MIVTCLSCGTRYQLEPSVLIPNGRSLRCVKCAHQWTERPPGEGPPVAAPEPDEVPNFGLEPAAAPRPRRRPTAARRRTPPKRRSGPLIAWGSLLAVVLVLAGVFVGLSEQIVEIFPAATPAYELIGLAEDPTTGINVENVKVNPLRQGEALVIEVTGQISNKAASARKIPPMRATLFAGRREVQTWTFEPPVAQLNPGQAADFSASLNNARGDGTNLVVSFKTVGG